MHDSQSQPPRLTRVSVGCAVLFCSRTRIRTRLPSASSRTRIGRRPSTRRTRWRAFSIRFSVESTRESMRSASSSRTITRQSGEGSERMPTPMQQLSMSLARVTYDCKQLQQISSAFVRARNRPIRIPVRRARRSRTPNCSSALNVGQRCTDRERHGNRAHSSCRLRIRIRIQSSEISSRCDFVSIRLCTCLW